MLLDPLLFKLKEGETFNVPDGIHTIRGYMGKPTDLILKRGVKIIGNNSIIQLDRPPDFIGVQTAFYSIAGGIEISGITIDLGCQHIAFTEQNYKTNGIFLEGGDNKIRDVTVTNIYGNAKLDHEAFAILALGAGSIIELCSVINICGDYVSGCVTDKGIVRSNNVVFPSRKPVGKEQYGGVFWFAYNIGGNGTTSTCQFVDNIASNATVGCYHDTGNIDSALIHNNTFINCDIGIFINKIVEAFTPKSYAKNITIRDNEIIMNPLALPPRVVISLGCGNNTGNPTRDNENCINDVMIESNSVTYAKGSNIPTDCKFLALTCPKPATDTGGVCNIKVIDNELDAQYQWGWRNMGMNAAQVSIMMRPTINWITT